MQAFYYYFDDSGTPAISISPSSWDFGITPVGTPVSKQFTIQNTGTLPLTIGDRSYPGGFTETVAPGSLSLAPNASTTFTVQATASVVGVFGGNISIVNNSSVNPKLVAITANVLWMPSELTNQIFWFGGQYAATITKDGSNRVGQWNNKFSGGNNLRQLDADSVKPVHSPSTLGITFDGIDDFLNFVSLITQSNWHIFMVCNIATKSVDSLFARRPTDVPFIRLLNAIEFDYRDDANVLDKITYTSSNLPVATNLLLEFKYSSALRELLVNGVSIGTDVSPAIGTLTIDTICNRNGAEFAQITIYEMIAVSAILANKTDLYAYFERDWAFLSLP